MQRYPTTVITSASPGMMRRRSLEFILLPFSDKENRLLNYMRLKTANITMNNISRKDLVIGFLLSVLLPNTIYGK